MNSPEDSTHAQFAATVLLLVAACTSTSVGTDQTIAGDARSSEVETESAADQSPMVEAFAPTETFVAPEPPMARMPESREKLRIAYSNVRVTVDGDIARTVVTEVLVNDADGEIEATFSFPLPGDAAVTDFADWREGVRIGASIAGKDAARKEFERATAAGETAALAEEDSGRHFKMQLSPIAGRGQRRVELSYTQTLSPLGGERRYTFPAKRYSKTAPTLLDLEVEIVNDRKITSARTWNHRDARLTRLSPQRYSMHLSRSREYLRHDVVVSWEQPVSELDLAGRSERRSNDESAYVETRFAFHRDPNPETRTPRNVIMVVDRSLSMAGSPLANAQELADLILEGLDERDSVSLISFARDVNTIDLAPTTRQHRSAIEEAIAEMTPSGHSNLGAALDEAAVQIADLPGGLLVLMTDGQPTVGEGLNSELHATHARDFADARVVIAHFNYPSRGKAMDALFPTATRHYIPDGNAGEDMVSSLAKIAIAPVIEDLSMEIVGANADSVHGEAPKRLAMGESIRLLARADTDVTVVVRGTLRGNPIELEQPIFVPQLAPDGPDRGLAIEWARLRIKELEGRFRNGETKLKASIRELGEEYHLGTAFTSFVATRVARSSSSASDSLSPDRIMPGDPEIRVRAPQNAGSVFGVLPWGEVVDCSWSDDEGLWLGRFLVPRGTPDGLYRVRLFVESQKRSTLRGTLLYRVDSAPPRFKLEASYEEGTLRLLATPVLDVFYSHGDSIRDDLVDLKRITVRIDKTVVKLKRSRGNTWTAAVPQALSSGPHELTLVAVDYAANSSEAKTTIEVPSAATGIE